MSDPTSGDLLKQYQAGESAAATAIFDRYVEKLMALARARISPQLQRRLDPQDVVQSAFRSFFVHAKNRDYQLTRSGDLWRLLARTTLNKLYGQVEKQTAERRSVRREVPDDFQLADFATHDPTIVEVVALGEQLRLILAGLSHEERVVLLLTLQGQSTTDICKELARSERTVRRHLAQAKQHFEVSLLGSVVQPTVDRVNCQTLKFEPHAPLSFADYVLEQLRGSGGMGKVYRATDKRSGKAVAVKALHKSRQSDERAVVQFVQESEILARLRHPNIVSVHGLGRFPSGGYFIVLDFVEGIDLQTRLETGPLPVQEAISIVMQVARAIQHAHEHGIVHCDLKPGNVLVDSRNHVFVTDFGFAFIMVKDSSLRSNGMIGGTEGYIPPEILYSGSAPTRAADIFAIGVLLWKLVSGKLPSECDSLDADKGLRGSIERICRQCFAEDPKCRYATVTDLIDALSLCRGPGWQVDDDR